MKENVLLDKSFQFQGNFSLRETAFASFAIRVVKLYKYLCDEKKEFILSKQLLRSGTSVCANINEAQEGQSKNDFISKLSISLKEARESKYWIELLKETNYLSDKEANSLLDDLIEILKLLTSVIKSTKENIKNGK